MSLDFPAYQVGRYTVTLAENTADIAEAQAFRAKRFGLCCALDVDALDAACDHIVIRDGDSGTIVCCYRLLPVSGDTLSESYAAQFYDVSALTGFGGQMLEIGRFCIDPERRDPDILRLAWAAMTEYVDAHKVTLLFGCSSFTGTDPEQYKDAFAYLRQKALAPSRWAPGRMANDICCFGDDIGRGREKRHALRQMPPLLRTYLCMGGWVSDHAVIDRAMNTLHVFTGVEIAGIPPERQRLLRALRHNGRSASSLLWQKSIDLAASAP